MAETISQRFADAKAWHRFVLLGGLGVVAALGQAPLDIWPATLLAFAILFWLYDPQATPKRAMWQVWAFGVGYFAFSLRWIVEPFFVDLARHGWMAPFAIILMAAGAALFWGLAAWLSQRFLRRTASSLGLMIVGAEITRSLILSGFPWALIGHVWITTPMAQLAAFGGPHLLSLLTIVAALALTALAGPRRMTGAVVLVAFAVAAFLLQPGAPVPPEPDAPMVRLVQPNAPQHQKWDPAHRDAFVRRMIAATGEGPRPDLVVWPETAIPYLLNHIEDDMRVIVDAARGAPLVFGIQRFDVDRSFYNSLVVMGPSGTVDAIYDKRHLVPFGEYMPGAALLGRAGMAGLARNLGTGFTPGATPGPVTIPGIGNAIPLICYEGIFAEEIIDGGDRARLLLLITNDAWFGQAAGPYQHLAQARLRAIEQGLPMVRVANTGISAMIDAKGRIIAHLPLGVNGALDVALPPALPPTFYVRMGDWPVVIVLILLTIGHVIGRMRETN
ncbi:apolipoprotein N-acyltransferase [Cognatiyoonia sp. IB215446]|uniref:apolipoprotein N-acyltransferase n=1 Tax=Cognatiyoonia sp. IB215446 TaxID=3097355 RepID=UPI002A0E9365|nr:apolipoprotein N-acyltransferase [Cognatiyoonia sp. IB215446]MDX8347957.1 apolipoprotein N-acyltransferase [Cognatiyoonia sp. IB215446]